MASIDTHDKEEKPGWLDFQIYRSIFFEGPKNDLEKYWLENGWYVNHTVHQWHLVCCSLAARMGLQFWRKYIHEVWWELVMDVAGVWKIAHATDEQIEEMMNLPSLTEEEQEQWFLTYGEHWHSDDLLTGLKDFEDSYFDEKDDD